MPQAVWIVLDPETPLGHHGFVDSAANGPWGTALVEEFIPALERQFRLIPRAEARIVTGHSSGGWSSLWLQLVNPEVFGACFSSSPDPVDFSRFQAGDLYADASVFCDAEGKERPSYRVPLVKQFDKVRMTVRDEAAMERVLGPARGSGDAPAAADVRFHHRHHRQGRGTQRVVALRHRRPRARGPDAAHPGPAREGPPPLRCARQLLPGPRCAGTQGRGGRGVRRHGGQGADAAAGPGVHRAGAGGDARHHGRFRDAPLERGDAGIPQGQQAGLMG
ncbi:MAG: hypothetical protein EBU31_18785 [Proteobacteria bacterium]|nr:hypothetical protein [Pseudomonadota bacterium]